FADALAREHRVIAFDALGTGESRGPPRASTRDLASDARTVLDARGVRRARPRLRAGGSAARSRVRTVHDARAPPGRAMHRPSRALARIQGRASGRGGANRRPGGAPPFATRDHPRARDRGAPPRRPLGARAYSRPDA